MEQEKLSILTQADKGDQTGYDVILEKHLNGKFAMKDMMEFFKERYICTVQLYEFHLLGTLDSLVFAYH